MGLKIKTFEFPSFEEWFETRKKFCLTIGKYTVHLEKDWPTLPIYSCHCHNISIDYYSFEFDDEKDVNNPEKMASFQKWYEDTCVNFNNDFEKYIYETYMKEDKFYD